MFTSCFPARKKSTPSAVTARRHNRKRKRDAAEAMRADAPEQAAFMTNSRAALDNSVREARREAFNGSRARFLAAERGRRNVLT